MDLGGISRWFLSWSEHAKITVEAGRAYSIHRAVGNGAEPALRLGPSRPVLSVRQTDVLLSDDLMRVAMMRVDS